MKKVEKTKIDRKNRKQFIFSRRVLKYVIYFSFVLIIGFCTRLIMQKTKKNVWTAAEDYYKKSCEASINRLSGAISEKIDEGDIALSVLANSSVVKSGNIEEIVSYLADNIKLMPDFFLDLIYSDTNGNMYVWNGRTTNIADRKYFQRIIRDGEERAVGNCVVSKTTRRMVVHISHAVRSSDGEISGLVAASIELAKFQEMMGKFDYLEGVYPFIIDEDGRYISHYDSRYLMRTFAPTVPEYEKLSSQYLASVRSGIFRSRNTKNKDVTVYLAPIENTGWSCAIGVPYDLTSDKTNVLKRARIMMIVGIYGGFLLLVVISLLVLNSRQFWETTHDPLTKLYTRQKFEKIAQTQLRMNKGARFVLIESDFRGFKFINQTYGEYVGNQVLRNIGEIFREIAKEYNAVCARGYADHFYFFVKIESVAKFMEKFEAAIEVIEQKMNEIDIQCYLKCGITFLLPSKENYYKPKSIQRLIGEASYAKSTIKKNILRQWAIYSRNMEEESVRDQRIESIMEKALENNEFYVVYQPKISLKDDSVVGAEALVRWKCSNPKLGIMSPDKFIPIFERNGFIVKLDFEVYEMVFKFLRRQLDAGKPVVPISVNMSRNHTNPDKFVREFVKRFSKYNLPTELIEVEFLERSEDDENTIAMLQMSNLLHAEGFSVAMDDFGRGQSSLNMLMTVPIDVLKFDQNFLRRETKGDSHELIRTLVELGHRLGKITLFEGVETEEQRDFLRSVNCDQAQGYFYSRPLSEENFIEYLQNKVES